MNPDPHRTRTLWLCTALHAFTHVYQVALIPLYLLIQKDFHLESEAPATFLVTALSIIYFLPSYPMGILADRFSRKKLLGLGLAINALGYIALAFAPTYGFAVAAVALAGFGGSFFHPSATALIARLYPEATGKALGRVGIGASIGFFIGPIYAGWRAEHAGWRAPILELGIFGLIGAALFLLLAHEHSAPVKSSEKNSPRQKLFPTPLVWIIFVSMAFSFCLRDFAGSGLATLGSLFLQRAHQFSIKETGLALSCIYLASAISNPLFGHLSDRGRVRWTALLLCAAAVTILILPHLSPHSFTPALAIYGFFFMATYPIVEAGLMEAVPDAVRGRVFGIFITIGGLLGNLSHWFAGHWVKSLGERANAPESFFGIYAVFAAMVLLSLIGLFFLHKLRAAEKAEKLFGAPVTPPCK